MKKVSVILTTYNSEKYLQRTLNSIFAQQGLWDEFEIELIVVDDCSTDETAAILRANQINYFSTETNSGGPNKGRNIALKKASGDFICFIDHDDTWSPFKIRLQLKAARQYPIVSSGYKVVYENQKKTIERYSTYPLLICYKKDETFLNLLCRNRNRQNVYFSTLMIKSELKSIFFEEHFGMVDYDWLLRLFHGRESAEVPLCLTVRNLDSNNLSLKCDYRKKDFYFSLYILESYASQYPKQVKISVKRLNGSRGRHYYCINRMEEARKHFLKSTLDLKTIAYWLTSYMGNSYVRDRFHIFG